MLKVILSIILTKYVFKKGNQMYVDVEAFIL